MAEASLSFLLDNVQALAVHHVNTYQNAESEFKLLEKELAEMKVVLEEAARHPREEEHFKAWEKQVRETVYEAEDKIDSWFIKGNSSLNFKELVQILREETVKPAFQNSVVKLASLPRSGTLVKRVDDVRDRRNKAPRNENVVGFEDEINTLVKCIYQKAEQLDVISIIGMPGLGKTTVAWKIYTDPRIQHDFPIRIWAYVSQDFNKKDLFLTIMKKFKMQDLSAKSEADLFLMVKKELETRRFLLFMDDVWDEETWNQIKEFLPTNNGNGKVLITSRYEKVGKASNDNRIPHQLRFLTDKESLELLQIEAFGQTSDFPKSLETMCTLIAGQCRGLPLAIIVIGGVLADKRSISVGDDETKAEWQKVSDSVHTHLQGDQENSMHKFISLSYTALPYHLRNPFLYMGMFPEDAEIPAWKLRQMWIGEGFILQKSAKSLEEVACDNLKDLIDRNLVQVDTIKPNGEVKTCRLHDTIREFCINEAAFENQNLFHEISKSKEGVLQPLANVIQNSRRLCFHSNVGEILSKCLAKQKGLKARALLCFSKEPITLDGKDIPTIINASTMIRVLETTNNIKFSRFPKVSNLVHLRYMSLSGDQFKMLPIDLSDLWNLQTIIVVTMHRTLDVKANLWKMVQLRHFKTRASVILKPEIGNSSKTLQTLGRLSPESCTKEVFEKAKNLNALGIRGDLNKLFDTKIFVDLSLLEKLKLFHDMASLPTRGNSWKSFPLEDKFPPKLKSLTLSNTYLDWPNMSRVGRLHTLEMLKLKEHAFEGKRWSRADSGDFVHLRFLHIERTNLEVWEADPGSFPGLRNLVLKNCEKLEAVPTHVGENLETMYLERVKKCIATSATEVEAKKNEGKRKKVFKLFVKPGCDM